MRVTGKVFVTLWLVVETFSAFGQRDVKEIRREFLNPDSKVVLVASHRAVHHRFPENSLPAVREGVRLGIDIIEIDVKVSKDGIPFLMHDRTMDRTTTGKGDPEEFTFGELQKLRLVVNGKETDERIPALEDVLKLAKGHIMVDLDLKTDRLDAIMKVVKKTGTQDIIFFFDNDYDALSTVEKTDANFMLMPRAYSQAMADSAIVRFGPEVVHIDDKFYTPEVTRLIKNNKARIWINALGIPDYKLRSGKVDETLDELLQFGANIVQTDEPELLLNALKKRGRH